MTHQKAQLWLFDLDNTLHDAFAEIFPQISENMNGWIATHCGHDGAILSHSEADGLRQAFWQRYGATLLGISRVPNQRARQFLEAAHQFRNLPAMVHAQKGLRHFFRHLPGKKVLLTNSSGDYARQVLAVRHLPVLLKTTPFRCRLVEDDIRSLKNAKITGMGTVLVTQYLNRSHHSTHAYARPRRKRASGRPSYVDIKVKSVLRLKRFLSR